MGDGNMSWKKWTPEEEETLAMLAVQGIRTAAIAELLDRPEKSVNRKRTEMVGSGRIPSSRRGPKPGAEHVTTSGLELVKTVVSPWQEVDGALVRTVSAA